MNFQSCTHRTSATLDNVLRAIRQEIGINFMQATDQWKLNYSRDIKTGA